MEWYTEDVNGVINARNNLEYTPKTIFYGSSTIRLWQTLYEDFDEFAPVNLGFGGSTLAACAWFFEDIIAPIKQADKFILYAGDNDLGDGRHPEEVCLFFQLFLIKLRQHFKNVPFYFISIKPSVSRFEIVDKIIKTNTLIKNEIANGTENEHYVEIFDKMLGKKGAPVKKYFDADGLHLSKAGYAVWKEALMEQVFKAY